MSQRAVDGRQSPRLSASRQLPVAGRQSPEPEPVASRQSPEPGPVASRQLPAASRQSPEASRQSPAAGRQPLVANRRRSAIAPDPDAQQAHQAAEARASRYFAEDEQDRAVARFQPFLQIAAIRAAAPQPKRGSSPDPYGFRDLLDQRQERAPPRRTLDSPGTRSPLPRGAWTSRPAERR